MIEIEDAIQATVSPDDGSICYGLLVQSHYVDGAPAIRQWCSGFTQRATAGNPKPRRFYDVSWQAMHPLQ